MIIAINARLLTTEHLEGIGHYSEQLIMRIARAHPQHTFYLLLDRPPPRDVIYATNVKVHIIWPPTRHPILWNIWFEHIVPAALKDIKADLFWSPDGFLSLRTEIPSVLTIHDIAFFHNSDWMKSREVNFYRLNIIRFLEKAVRVITVSESVKLELVSFIPQQKDKIHTIHNGINPSFIPISEPDQALIRAKYSKGLPFFIYLGSIHPRKNIESLILAFYEFKERTQSKTKIILAGQWGWKSNTVKELLTDRPFFEDVIILHEFEEDVFSLLASAQALTYVSLYEGFGLPVVEAMQAGTPVICSNRGAIKEVSSDAALCVNPLSSEEIADAMVNIENDPLLQKSLREKGLMRAKDFCWDIAAEKTAEILFNTLNPRQP